VYMITASMLYVLIFSTLILCLRVCFIYVCVSFFDKFIKDILTAGFLRPETLKDRKYIGEGSFRHKIGRHLWSVKIAAPYCPRSKEAYLLSFNLGASYSSNLFFLTTVGWWDNCSLFILIMYI